MSAFHNNSGVNGADFYLQLSQNNNATIQSSVFFGSQALSGGSIYLRKDLVTTGNILIDNCNFTAGRSLQGGAMYLNSNSMLKFS